MIITPAWTKQMQALGENTDVQAVAEAASLPGTLDTVARLIRDHDGSNPDIFRYALTGAYKYLQEDIDAALQRAGHSSSGAEIAERVEATIQAVRTMYANAADENDLGKRRGKILELLVYRRIKDFYDEGDCQLDCMIIGSNAHYEKLDGREFDVCAWDEARTEGEAYECAVRPYGLLHRDCQALVMLSMAVQEEYTEAGREPWFRIGLVCFERRQNMMARVRKLAKTQTERDQFDLIEAYGWDNLDTITQ